MKPARIVLIDDAKEAFVQLNKIVREQAGKENTEEMQLIRSIKQKSELIKTNPFYGDNIQKQLIPKKYKTSGELN